MEKNRLSIAPGSQVLVTGATGFTGTVLVRKLVNQGAKVRAIARPSSNIQPLADLPVQWIYGDVFDPAIVEEAVRGTNYIFHLATPYREAKLPDSTFHKVHVFSTQLLAKAALKEDAFRRFVHVSTVGVHGHIEHPPADENSPLRPGDVYQETKVEAELWIRNFAANEELPLVTVRPAAIYGPRDQRLLKVFKMVSRGWVPLIGKGNYLLYHLIHVEDLADFLVHVAVHPKAIGEVFICGSQQAISFQEIISIISKYYGKSVKYIKLPTSILFVLSDLIESICKPLGIEPPLYRRRVAFFTKDRSFDTSKMGKLVNFLPAYSDKEGLTTTAQWYEDQGII